MTIQKSAEPPRDDPEPRGVFVRCGVRTPSSVTLRPCAMRPMMRSVPASRPAP